MKIEINDSNRVDVAMMFEKIAQAIQQESSQATSIAVNFFKTGVVVEIEGTMKEQIRPGIPVPDGMCFGRYGILIHDDRLKVLES